MGQVNRRRSPPDTVEYLSTHGPCLSSAVVASIQASGVSYDAARKRVQREIRLSSEILVLDALKFPRNVSIPTRKCSQEDHAKKRRERKRYCVHCGEQLAAGK